MINYSYTTTSFLLMRISLPGTDQRIYLLIKKNFLRNTVVDHTDVAKKLLPHNFVEREWIFFFLITNLKILCRDPTIHGVH